MTQKFVYSIYSDVVYLLTARRYFYQDGFTQNWFLLWILYVTEKPCFELSRRSNIAQRHWNLLKLTAIFIASPMKKPYLAVHLTSGKIFCEFVGRQKVLDLPPKYSLLAGETKEASNFSPCMIYKWGNSIEWSTKLSLTREGLS